MEKIIFPVNIDKIEVELTEGKFLRNTNNGGNKLYIITAHDSPNVMKEIGRLREITFRAAGGGTGKKIDIDDFDISDVPYKQLIVWNPKEKQIIGGYRYLECKHLPKGKNAIIKLATSRLFRFSSKFVHEYLPYMIELGRSFVIPAYQASKSNKETIKKGLYTLDNLWDGLGAILHRNPEVKYFFGKVTMYPNYIRKARDMVLFFLRKHFNDKEKLMRPHRPLKISTDEKELHSVFSGKNYLEDYKILLNRVRSLGENIPPLINSYMNLSPTMRTFGTALNKTFGNVEETGIMVTIEDIYKTKKDRHLLVPQK